FAIPLEQLRAANPSVTGDPVLAGQVLVVLLPDRPADGGLGRARYVIQPGDTLSSTARQCGTSLSLLQQANVFLAPIPGLGTATRRQVPAPRPPGVPEGFPSGVSAPFGERLGVGDDDSAFVPFPPGLDFRLFGRPAGDGVFVNANGNL